MKKSEYDKARLLHILEAINYIETFFVGRVKDDLYGDPMLRFAIERQLEIIGEAANHLSEKIKTDNRGIEWQKLLLFEISLFTNTSVSILSWCGILLLTRFRF